MPKYNVVAPFVDKQSGKRHTVGETVELSKARGDLLIAARCVEPVKESRTEAVETADTQSSETTAKRTKADE